MSQVHKVELHEAKGLIKVLPLDEAEKTVEDYNRKFVSKSGLCRAKLRLENKDETGSSSSGATTSQIQPSQMAVCNKNFKCVKCHFRSSRPGYVSVHFKKAHSEVALTRLECVEVLDENEAERTLATYDQIYRNDSIDCKPFKCGICEFRVAKKSNVYSHMRRVHKIGIHDAKLLVHVLSLDEAEKTVGDYNKKFVCESGRYCPKLCKVKDLLF
jgi:hypothetical protein